MNTFASRAAAAILSVVATARGAEIRRRVPLGWTTTRPAQPYVELEVGGVRTHALVDTGASDHVVARALADDAGLVTVSMRAHGVDHGAGAMDLRGLASTPVTIPGWGPLSPSLRTARDDAAFAVASVHARFRALGLGAFVSPQRLVEPGHAVVVDLPRSELVEVAIADLRAELDTRGDAALFTGATSRCLHGQGPRAGVTWLTDALVEGQPARLLVDTGAAFGDLFRTSTVGRALLARRSGTSTLVTAARTVEAPYSDDLTVRIGEVQRSSLRWNLVDSQGAPVCPYDGVLAIDVLRACAVAFDGKNVSGRCAVAPTTPGVKPQRTKKRHPR